MASCMLHNTRSSFHTHAARRDASKVSMVGAEGQRGRRQRGGAVRTGQRQKIRFGRGRSAVCGGQRLNRRYGRGGRPKRPLQARRRSRQRPSATEAPPRGELRADPDAVVPTDADTATTATVATTGPRRRHCRSCR